MKKIKYLLVAFIMLFGFTLNTYALENTDVSYKATLYDWEDNYLYDMIINSNSLSSDLKLELKNIDFDLPFKYVNNDFGVYAEGRYIYELIDNNTKKPITELSEEIEILIHQENLIKDTKYDVYFYDTYYEDGIGTYYVVDEEHLGNKAEVVEVDSKLYIKFQTNCLKSFVLDMEISEEFQNEWKKISTDDYFLFPAVKPSKEKLGIVDLSAYFGAFLQTKRNYTISPLNEYEIDNDYQLMLLEFENIPGEKQVVKYKWKIDKNPDNISKKMEEMEKIIIENSQPLDKLFPEFDGIYFEIEDLNYINFLANNNFNDENFNVFERAINYSSELKNIFKNNNFKYYFEFRAGNTEPGRNYALGYMLLGYNDLIYELDFKTAYYIKPVIYIPSNTKNTDEAYIKEAKKRISKYLGTDDFEIEVAGTRESLTQDFNLSRMWKDFYDEANLSDNYYYITINGQRVEFVFEKNDKKIKEIEFKTKDLETDVEINSSSGSIPLDTLIEVDVIGKYHKEFKEILEVLKKEDGMIYDLSLYSETLSKYITKLDNDKFKVRIPLKDEFKNKKLKAYYIADNNDIEEYDIVIEDGYAVFETNHFSTYTIAESGEIENPDTFDGIISTIIICFISFIGFCVSIYFLNRKSKLSI